MNSIVLASPAKLNLLLHILGKRKDGYHELVTVFHRISLSDTLRLEKRRDEQIRLICSHPKVPLKDNLIVRAFRLLKSTFPFRGGVTVRLTKRIPVGGGLGGGSSNSATFLLGMNRLFRLGLSREKLVAAGKKLGADIPFFLSEIRQAWGRGRGDEIKPLPSKGRFWFLLFPSGRGLSTREVYAGFRMKQRVPSLTRAVGNVKIRPPFPKNGNLIRAERYWMNDLTRSAERIRPSVRRTREKLSGLQLGTCRMSGSGPTLFMAFPSQSQARRLRFLITKKLRYHKPILLCHSL